VQRKTRDYSLKSPLHQILACIVQHFYRESPSQGRILLLSADLSPVNVYWMRDGCVLSDKMPTGVFTLIGAACSLAGGSLGGSLGIPFVSGTVSGYRKCEVDADRRADTTVVSAAT